MIFMLLCTETRLVQAAHDIKREKNHSPYVLLRSSAVTQEIQVT